MASYCDIAIPEMPGPAGPLGPIKKTPLAKQEDKGFNAQLSKSTILLMMKDFFFLLRSVPK